MNEAQTNDLSSGFQPNQNEIYNKPPEQITNKNIDNPYILVSNQNENSYYIPHGKIYLSICITLSIFLFPISPILICIILFGLTKGLEFRKDSDDKIIATESGYSCNSKSYNFIGKYTSVQVKPSGYEEYGTFCRQRNSLHTISLYNTNPDEIDLDTSNVKNVPFKPIHNFQKYIGEEQDIYLNLKNFFSGVFQNQIKEELKIYDPTYKESIINLFPFEEQCLKLNDYYYTFYGYSSLMGYYKSPESFERIDWIYSKNFDRIFIGVVKNDTTYITSYTYQLNEISKFVLVMKGKGYVFQIFLKGNNYIDICTFYHQDNKNLNSFIYLINGQINSKLNNNNDIPPANIPTLQ